MKIDLAIIGGTGVGERLAELGGVPLFVPTPEGILRGRRLEKDGLSLMVVSRHSQGHKVPPHKVRYAAMALGLKQLGVKACLSTAAVGSLKREWTPGTLVACSDFLDLSFRNLTMYNAQVVHRDFSEPFSTEARNALISSAAEQGVPIQERGTYVNGNGPRYETAAEIEAYRTLGGDLVGMTAGSEAILFREAGVKYGCLAIVTNLAAGMADEELDHQDVVSVMRASSEVALAVVLGAAKLLAHS